MPLEQQRCRVLSECCCTSPDVCAVNYWSVSSEVNASSVNFGAFFPPSEGMALRRHRRVYGQKMWKELRSKNLHAARVWKHIQLKQNPTLFHAAFAGKLSFDLRVMDSLLRCNLIVSAVSLSPSVCVSVIFWWTRYHHCIHIVNCCCRRRTSCQ